MNEALDERVTHVHVPARRHVSSQQLSGCVSKLGRGEGGERVEQEHAGCGAICGEVQWFTFPLGIQGASEKEVSGGPATDLTELSSHMGLGPCRRALVCRECCQHPDM